MGGDAPDQRIEAVRSIVPKVVAEHVDEIALRKAVWIVNRRVSEMKVSSSMLSDGKRAVNGFDFSFVLDNQRNELMALIDNLDVLDLPSRIPVKNTGIPAKIVKALGFPSFDAYKRGVLKRLDRNDIRARRMIVAMRRRLTKLPK